MNEQAGDPILGRVTIAPNVLVTIVQHTASGTPGVACLSDQVPGVKRFLGFHTVGRGVEVNVVGDCVTVDVYLIAQHDVDLLQMGRTLQRAVARAIVDILGMQVRAVHVHIEDIELDSAQLGRKETR
jgi:uncharacterized alkaline shock family protein YloU